MYNSFKSWQVDFLVIRQKHKLMGSIFLFFMLLGINFSLNQLGVHVFSLTEAYFTDFTSQVILPLVSTFALYPRANEIT
jgi:hypothetical protein